ncbi:MAG: bifunctional folylpolyglutamate synthase/dihydrofolate synthase [Candidatus Nitronauta litoralis]|uniref:Dihydrofolate synthase/folylpolyglutamate synthase n=1 Tax=Candidatus Nitronauta litoralis TaxID=2705533 RepID=A0A7T0BXV2_9BACT|nr:MAG: bifunctional folylpolyglutamate synthase/dihydrofolate synthase [Candidatus Nitronauta litoralis]
MNYEQTCDYLDDLIKSGIKLGLENTSRLLKALGNPQLKVPTVHIAGTNGKGSTAIFTESILRSAGYRTGLYTSPHLLDYRERIQVNRQEILPEELAQVATCIKEACEQENIPATYFEVATAIAFLHFFQSGCEWNIIEVGMGGRLDSTNLCKAQVSVITSISKDHESSLGQNLEAIAAEKAAIIKPGGTVLAGKNKPEVCEVIEAWAREKGCPVEFLGREFKIRGRTWNGHVQTFDWSSPDLLLEGLEIPLLGEFQVQNAALAVAATRQAVKTQEAVLSEHYLRSGLKNAYWPGRMEVVETNPIVLLDCAHNPDSVKKLTDSIREHFRFEKSRVILGVMKDKDLPQIAEIIGSFADEVYITQPRMERSADPHNLFKLLQISNKVIEIIDEIQYALHTAKNRSGPRDLILVTGSVFTIAEAKQSIEHQKLH